VSLQQNGKKVRDHGGPYKKIGVAAQTKLLLGGHKKGTVSFRGAARGSYTYSVKKIWGKKGKM